MVLYRFLFAPVLLAVATFLGAGQHAGPREPTEPRGRTTVVEVPRDRSGVAAERRPRHANAAPEASPISAKR